MLRTVIHIDEDACTGCRLCVDACHEGALGMVDGKAKLLRDDFCDGMGDCLPACPADAITFVEREALPYNEQAVIAARGNAAASNSAAASVAAAPASAAQSELAQWPCQIKLLPMQAPYYQGADLLVAADCTAFACASFHRDVMRGKVTAVGCPKLDGVDYSEKLGAILALNDIRSVTVARMEVPCCGGLERATAAAVAASGKELPFSVITFSVRGEVL